MFNVKSIKIVVWFGRQMTYISGLESEKERKNPLMKIEISDPVIGELNPLQ